MDRPGNCQPGLALFPGFPGCWLLPYPTSLLTLGPQVKYRPFCPIFLGQVGTGGAI